MGDEHPAMMPRVAQRRGPHLEPITTERLILRQFAAGDFDALFAYQSRPDVTQWLLWDARTRDEVRVALDKKLASVAIVDEGDVLALAMTRKDTGELVGDVILEFVSAEHRTGEIGYIVHPDHQGLGYTTEACREILRIAFQDLGLHRVIGRIEPRNLGSARILQKLGMRHEAHFAENEFIKGEWQSEDVYAILDREWRDQTERRSGRADAEALLITGLFGTGKSSVAVEVADILEKRGLSYAVIDLDWLCWGFAGGGDGSEHRMMLANLAPVIANYLDVGVRSFVLARSLRTRDEVESLRAALPMPLRVVGLVVPLDEIERRLGSDITAGRADGLRDVAEWVAAGDGSGFEDLTIVNDRPLRVVADEIVAFMGWDEGRKEVDT
jgi:RimJ/RimL family protein N-acetyltransferase